MVTESPSPARIQVVLPRSVNATDCRFVDRDEFCQLAISNKTLLRCDDPENSTRGLFDPATGIRYAIAEGNLFLTEPLGT
jgi:hypothetical protein